MFKKITIELAGPICSCKTQDLSWGVSLGASAQPTMYIQCRLCETKLTVGWKAFVASFTLDNAYPEGPMSKKPDAKVLKLHKEET